MNAMAGELEKKTSWIDSTREYFTDIRSEMRRVTWPNRKQVESTTLIVILSSLLRRTLRSWIKW